MIKPIQKYLNFINRLLDAGLIAGSYYLALYIWLIVFRDDPANIALAMRSDWLIAVCCALCIVLAYQIMGLYDSLRARPVGRDILRVLEANAIVVLMLAALLYAFRLQEYSRGALALFYTFSSLFVLLKRGAMRYTLRYIRRLGYNQKHVLLVGDGPLAAQYAASILSHPQYGFSLDGYIGEPDCIPEIPCMGGFGKIEALLSGPDIDEVVVALETKNQGLLAQIIAATEKQGAKLCIIPFFNDFIPACTSIEVVGESKLISIRTTPLDNPMNAMVKRTGDILGSVILIILSSPLMLLAAIGTKLSSPGPILFRQVRVGLNKKNFTMYKFRSLKVNTTQDTAWSTDRDARRTKFGSFMRKTSIDELPQFFNVLKGDMSLIGPRPEIPFYVDKFREEIPLYMVKHRVRPGITGWAQVHGLRGDTSIKERILHDIWYIENWTIWLDIRILFMTAFGGMVNKEKLS